MYKTLSEDQYEIPISRSGQMKSKSEERCERISDDGYEIPIRRQFSNSVVEFRDDSADRMSSDINSEDVINSDERGNENKMISSFRSVPYVPEPFSTENVRQKPSGLFSDSRVNEARKYSSENRK